MKKFLFAIWELPQKIAAIVVKKVTKASKIGEYNEVKIYHWKWSSGLSLSNSIFVPFKQFDETEWQVNYVRHEYGHTIQSLIFGPIYLLVIGTPSFLWAWLGKNYRSKNNISYYSFYTEKWADYLGGAKHE